MTSIKKEIMEEFEEYFPGDKRGLYQKQDFKQFLSLAFTRVGEEAREKKITEDTSDGYHTFKELYEFRKLYNAALFNEWSKQGKYNIHKSKRHHDGELCFGGGWFIVMAQLPTGQISNHYELKDWDLFQCEEREKAEEWDGHTAQDVAKRLDSLVSPSEEKECECYCHYTAQVLITPKAAYLRKDCPHCSPQKEKREV